MTRLRLRPAGCLAAVYLPSVGCAYGVESILLQCEARGVPYLFKLKHTLNLQRLVQLCLRRSHWEDAGDGWQCMESHLQLKGWSRARRVILVREAPAVAPVGAGKRRRRDHFEPPLAEGEGWDAQPHPWSGRIAVPVTSEAAEGGFSAAASVRHYRERANAEPERSGDSQPLPFKTAGITSLTKPKTNGDGVDIPPGKSPLAASWPPSSPWFTTGGTYMSGFTMKPITAKP